MFDDPADVPRLGVLEHWWRHPTLPCRRDDVEYVAGTAEYFVQGSSETISETRQHVVTLEMAARPDVGLWSAAVSQSCVKHLFGPSSF